MHKGNLVIRICIYLFLFSHFIFIEPLLPQTKKQQTSKSLFSMKSL